MQYVEVKPHHFINAALVREFQYTPAGNQETTTVVQPGGAADEAAPEEAVSSLLVTFANGDQRFFTGRDADSLFAKLKGSWN